MSTSTVGLRPNAMAAAVAAAPPVDELQLDEVEAEIDVLDARLQLLWARQQLLTGAQRVEPSSGDDSGKKALENERDDRTWISARHVTVKRRVGAGFFGEVFEGSWRSIPVALKTLTSQSESAALEMLKESDVLETLDHPNVLRFYGIVGGEAPPSWPKNARVPCICTEFMTGGTLLEKLLRTTDAEAAEVAFWKAMATHARDAARGLAYLHDNRLMHRDLKAENLLLSADGVVKIADFGLAKAMDARLKQTTSVGTFSHMAPEVMMGKYNAAADLFSFGIVLTEILTLQEAQEIIDATRTDKFGLNVDGLVALLDPLTQPAACYALAALAGRCCALAPLDRLGARELEEECAALCEDASGFQSPPTLQEPPPASSAAADAVAVRPAAHPSSVAGATAAASSATTPLFDPSRAKRLMGLRTRNRHAAGGGGGGVGSVSAAWGQTILNLVHGEAATQIASAAVPGQRMEEVRGRHASVVPVFGIDKELAAKAALKYQASGPLEMELRKWIAASTGREQLLDESIPFPELIDSGETLCELANAYRPGAVKRIVRSAAAYRQMDNVFAFLRACEAEGLAQTDRFEMPDLFERRNLSAVLHTLDLLRAHYHAADMTAPPATAPAPLS